MKTLFDYYPEIFSKFTAKFPNIVEASKTVNMIHELEDAIGASRGCVSHWIRGSNAPGMGTERRAGAYLRFRQNNPIATPAATAPNPEASMFLISVPEGSKAKAAMLISMLRNINCEVVDF